MTDHELPKLQHILYRDAGGQWRWRIEARNNRIIASSGEAFHNRADCIGSMLLIHPDLLVDEIDDRSGDKDH